MTREWQPGDVAMVNGHVALRLAFSAFTCPGTHKFDGDHWHAADGHWFCDDSTSSENGRPLVVIDPEDREQVERLEMDFAKRMGWFALDHGVRANALQAALREFADLKSEKPDEPTGLGAVVEDDKGDLWVRTCTAPCSTAGPDCQPWERVGKSGSQLYAAYADIDAVKVLSEGVTP